MYLPNWLSRFIRFALIGSVSISLYPAFAMQVGVIDEVAVLQASSSKAFLKPSEKKFEKCKTELNALYKRFEKLNSEFNENAMVMDEKTQKQKQTELLKLQKKLQTKALEMQEQQKDMQEKLAQRLLDTATKVAKQKKLNLIFSKGMGVIYADTQLDVTKDAVALLPYAEGAMNKTSLEKPLDDLTKDAEAQEGDSLQAVKQSAIEDAAEVV